MAGTLGDEERKAKKTLRTILCNEECWHWDRRNYTGIKFNEDGTGELHLCQELCVFIGAEIEWSATGTVLEEIVDIDTATHDQSPHLLKQFSLEITLRKRRTSHYRSSSWQRRLNEDILTDDAFCPQTYTIRLEKGDFLDPCDARDKIETDVTGRSALRLKFDKSPYPPQQRWKEPELGPDQNRFWEWDEFAGRRSEELEEQAKRAAQRRSCVMF